MKTLADRFWAKVQKTSNCWLWNGAKDTAGYGNLWHNKTCSKASRTSWQLHYGEIPKGLFVCHHCDTQGCVRPEHLFLGTHRDNMMDAYNKGRLSHSTAAYYLIKPKLTKNIAKNIKQLWETKEYTQGEIGKLFDVHGSVVCRIVNDTYHSKTIE